MQLLCKAVNEQCVLKNWKQDCMRVIFLEFPLCCVFDVWCVNKFMFFWDEMEFMERVMSAKHPLDVALAILVNCVMWSNTI